MIGRMIRRWRRRRILEGSTLDDALWQRVVADLQVLDGLTDAEIARLRTLVVLFLHFKRFYSTHELQVTDYMRVVVAAQACLLVLHMAGDDLLDPYPGWISIVLYPGTFVTRHQHHDEIGLVHEVERELDGEASELGPLVLSWEDTRPHRAWEPDGANVVIHEFTHKLDFMDGSSNGSPPLPKGMSPKAWAEAFTAAFEDLNRLVEHGHPTPIDDYAATDPAECFAVFTEEFFERPHHLRHVYPEVYGQMVAYFGQDPGQRVPVLRSGHPRHHHGQGHAHRHRHTHHRGTTHHDARCRRPLD